MRLDNATYEYIKQEVANMFVDYDIKGVPINAFEVAVKIGLTVIPYSALPRRKRRRAMRWSEDGYSVEKNTGQWIIYYNDTVKDFTRINQTVMHEIGHYILGHIEGGKREEAEAAFFAKYALASPPLIHYMMVPKTPENVMENMGIGYQASCFAIGYYQKWLLYGPEDYTPYEIQILEQLEIEVA